MMLSAVNNASDRMRIDKTPDINVVEDMFVTDIKRHMKMKALGTQKFPALGVAIEILRTYVTVPRGALNEFVASTLNDDIRARIDARAQAAQGFVAKPTPEIVPPQAPPILRMQGPAAPAAPAGGAPARPLGPAVRPLAPPAPPAAPPAPSSSTSSSSTSTSSSSAINSNSSIRPISEHLFR